MIREVKGSDFDALYDIYMDETINPYLSFEIMEKENFKPIYEALNKSGQHFALFEENILVSTMIVIRHPRRVSHVATLSTLATSSSHQGKGLTKYFLNQIIEMLKKDGIKRIDLMAEADNPKAIGFYQKMGFEIEGQLKNCYKRAYQDYFVDEILMAKLI